MAARFARSRRGVREQAYKLGLAYPRARTKWQKVGSVASQMFSSWRTITGALSGLLFVFYDPIFRHHTYCARHQQHHPTSLADLPFEVGNESKLFDMSDVSIECVDCTPQARHANYGDS